jgi:hypothetical protein
MPVVINVMIETMESTTNVGNGGIIVATNSLLSRVADNRYMYCLEYTSVGLTAHARL